MSSSKLIAGILGKQQENKKLRFLDGKEMIRNIETDVSKEIRILAEVEKIWIIFDGDENGTPSVMQRDG